MEQPSHHDETKSDEAVVIIEGSTLLNTPSLDRAVKNEVSADMKAGELTPILSPRKDSEVSPQYDNITVPEKGEIDLDAHRGHIPDTQQLQ
jgi:hypothetical protein